MKMKNMVCLHRNLNLNLNLNLILIPQSITTILMFLLLLMLFCTSRICCADFIYQYMCDGSDSDNISNSTTSSSSGGDQYEKNLLQALKQLSHSISAASSGGGLGFASAEVGRKTSHAVYAEAECRGDATASECTDSFNQVLRDFPNYCGRNGTDITAWVHYCFVRWSSPRDLRGTLRTDAHPARLYDRVYGDAATYQRTAVDLVRRLSAQAASVKAGHRFSSGSAAVASGNQSIHALVQCFQGLTAPGDCSACLARATDSVNSSFFFGDAGGFVLLGSCGVIFNDASAAASVSSDSSGKSRRKFLLIVGLASGCAALLLLVVVLIFISYRKRSIFLRNQEESYARGAFMKKDKPKLYSMKTLIAATKNFHEDCKLGQGAFGVVYKGTLQDGAQIAVKKFTMESLKPDQDFMNEIQVLAEIRHRNLVRLFGGCVQGNQRMLVYEYMKNNSLDQFLVDSEKRKTLDWNTRYNIIVGVARGLMYLHEEAICTIIHRDIKAANVLLDDKLNPKIADFGLAKFFPEDLGHMQCKLVGTWGYLAPEYIAEGKVSTKVDVYSYGIVMLEIISGRKNSDMATSTPRAARNQCILQRAWLLHELGRVSEIVDETIKGKCKHEDVVRLIHVALLCTQENPSLRPLMSEVTVMLTTNQAISVPRAEIECHESECYSLEKPSSPLLQNI